MHIQTEGHGVEDIVKSGVAWIGVGLSHLGITHWSDVAAVLTTVYTSVLLVDYLRRRYNERKAEKGLK